VDRFADADSWREFLREHGADYAELDSRCAAVTTSELEIR
jgi:hypothetical protein